MVTIYSGQEGWFILPACDRSKSSSFICQIDAEKALKNETKLPDYQIPIDKVLNFPESLERKFMN